MPTPKRSDQVHISGMAARAARLAKEYHCGYEITAFSYADVYKRQSVFSSTRRRMACMMFCIGSP